MMSKKQTPLFKAVVTVTDTPEGGLQLDAKFYKISSETLTSEGEIKVAEADKFANKSPSLNLVYGWYKDIADRIGG